MTEEENLEQSQSAPSNDEGEKEFPSRPRGKISKTITIESSISGPLPPPLILDQYEQALPGAAERIIKMAEEQSRHRREMESVVIKSNSRIAFLGWLSASVLALVTIIGSIFLIYSGYSVVGLGTIIATLVTLVSVFIYSKKQQEGELAEKRKKLEKN